MGDGYGFEDADHKRRCVFHRDGVRIPSLRPFAAAQFRRHPEWDDVRDGAQR